MSGAILGATTDVLPENQVADRRYIEREAERMWAISDRRRVPSFPYPSLVNWSPPRPQLDSLGLQSEGHPAVAGLGPAQMREEVSAKTGEKGGSWSWLDLWFGQRLLVRHRPRPSPLTTSQIVEPAQPYLAANLLDAPPLPPLREARSSASDAGAEPSAKDRTLHRITDEVISGGFDPESVGQTLLELADRDDGIERAGEYAAIIAKAHLSRRTEVGAQTLTHRRPVSPDPVPIGHLRATGKRSGPNGGRLIREGQADG